MTQRFIYSLLIVIVLSSSACQPTKPFPETGPDKELESVAAHAEQSGDFQTAAQHYLSLAQQSRKQVQAHYYLLAAQNFWQAGDIEHARQTLAQIDLNALSSRQRTDARILQSQIALVTSNAEEALTILDNVDIKNLSPEQQKAVLKLRIQAYEITENLPEKVNNLIALDSLLSGPDREENQQQLWQALMRMSPQSLKLYNPGLPYDIKSGWYELAYIIKTYQDKPEVLDIALENWHRDYPTHPAPRNLYQSYLTQGTRLPTQIPVIAVLLPESGRYQHAANAIRHGIIAAHYNAHSNTELRFYPIDNQHSVETQYQQSVSEGASIIIGPLAKASVKQLAQLTQLTVPVLALNRIEESSNIEHLFQFGLAPEDDARSIADFASQKLFQRAVALFPNTHWGQRVFTAFQDQWLNNGGIILNHAVYDSQKNDFSDTIKPLLGLDQSIQRKVRLQRILGIRLDFEPRRRQDIDFIFLAAKPQKARQLVPQLKFHRAGNLPILATSQAYSAQQNKQQNIDLNHLIITDIPWILDPDKEKDPVYTALKQNQAQNFDQVVRLYALGVDAYRIIPYLNRLSRSPESSFQGATGQLSIDKTGRIKRKTPWGIFKEGWLTPLKEIDD